MGHGTSCTRSGPSENGLSQFVWADLDGDGSPDAAFLDGKGQLVVLQNKRSGVFTPWPVPADIGNIVALSAADVDRDGTQDLTLLTTAGKVTSLTRHNGAIGMPLRLGASAKITLLAPSKCAGPTWTTMGRWT